jgi:hypothetical protein
MSPAANTPGPALADREARALREPDIGRHARPDHDRVRGELEPSPAHHLADAPIALEALELVVAVDAHAVRFEQVLEEAPDTLPEATLERVLLLHHQRAVLAQHRQ